MTNRLRPAGNTTVNTLILVSFENMQKAIDIRPNFVSLNFSESMMSPFMFGHIDIAEPRGMLYASILDRTNTHPHIRGEEFLYIEYEDHNNITRKETYFVYAIDNIGLLDGNRENAMQYRLHFASIQKVFSDKYLIQKTYRNMSYSEMIRAIFQEYYIDKPKEFITIDQMPAAIKSGVTLWKGCEIETTDERHTLVIPSLRPEEAIQYIMRRAYSEANSSSLFFFFESRDQFWFITHEQLVTRNKALIEAEDFNFNVSIGGNDSSPDGQLAARQTIRNTTFASMNSIEAMKQQAYSRSIGEIDLLNRNVQLFYYDYKQDYLGYNNIDTNPQLPNSTKYIEAATGDKLNIADNYVFKDYLSPEEGDAERNANYDRTLPRYLETLATKPVFSYHFQKHTTTGTIAGRHFLCPGYMVKTVAPEYTIDAMTAQRDEDKYFNGPQMVVTLLSTIQDDVWTQQITLSKGTRGGGPLTNNPGAAVGVSQISQGVDSDGDGLDDSTGANITPRGTTTARQPSRAQAEAEQQAMDYFTGLTDSNGNRVYTDAQAAGIVANLANESGMNEFAINYNDGGPGKDSIGLAQWNRDRLDNLQGFAEARGEDSFELVNGNRVPSFETQLAFVDHELRGESGITGNGAGSESRAYNSLVSSTSPTTAAVAMTRYERFYGYEGGLSGSHEVRERAADAGRILGSYEAVS